MESNPLFRFIPEYLCPHLTCGLTGWW